MYSQPDIEDHLDKTLTGPKAETMEDIWNGSVLWDLTGPDGLPFI
jgi:hypothetical protein